MVDYEADEVAPTFDGTLSLSHRLSRVVALDNLSALKLKLPRLLRDRLEEHLQVLKQKPSVAVLLVDGAEEEVPDIVVVKDRATTHWHGQKRVLLIIELADERRPADDNCNPGAGSVYAPWEQVQKLVEAVEYGKLAAGRPKDGPFCWPLHSWQVCHEIEMHAAYAYELQENTWWRPVRWVLANMFILPARPGEGVNKLYEEQFGMEVGFDVCWSQLHVQSAWALATICAVLFFLGIRPSSEGKDKILWGCGLAAVWIWRAIFVALHRRAAQRFKDHACYTKNPNWCGNETTAGKAKRWGFITFPGLPILFCYWALLLFIFSVYTQLVLTVTYRWGRCIERMEETPDIICRDPQMEHGFGGLIAEIGCDVGLVIIFEICCGIGNSLAGFLSNLMNFKWQEERRLFELKFVTALATIERIAFVSMLALLWAPKWQEPLVVDDWVGEPGWEVDTARDCSDLILSHYSAVCMQRRVGVKGRRFLFEKLMKGPFVVAPFICILMKVIVPILVNTMVYASRECGGDWRSLGCFRGFWRIAALIFSFDGGNVGGLKFVCNGWPYTGTQRSEPVRKSAAAGQRSGDAVRIDTASEAVAAPEPMALRAAAAPSPAAGDVDTDSDAAAMLETVPLRGAAAPSPAELSGIRSAEALHVDAASDAVATPETLPLRGAAAPSPGELRGDLGAEEKGHVPKSEPPELPALPDLRVKEQPAPDLRVKEQPAPDLRVKEQPAPDLRVKEQPAPDLRVKEQPAPDLRVKEQPAPDLRVKDPDAEQKVAPKVPKQVDTCPVPHDEAPVWAMPPKLLLSFSRISFDLNLQDAGCKEIESWRRIDYALVQSARKNYNAMDELLEIKMRKLWLLYFTPIMPWGVWFTLCASILEVYFDVAKLLWTRARPVPSTSRLSLEACCAYDLANLSGALGWYVSLLLLAYNDDLHTWEGTGFFTLMVTVFWQWISYNLPMAFYSNE